MMFEEYLDDGVNTPWRELSKLQVFQLWIGGVLLGSELMLIFGALADGRPIRSLFFASPILVCLVAVIFVVQALWRPSGRT